MSRFAGQAETYLLLCSITGAGGVREYESIRSEKYLVMPSTVMLCAHFPHFNEING